MLMLFILQCVYAYICLMIDDNLVATEIPFYIYLYVDISLLYFLDPLFSILFKLPIFHIENEVNFRVELGLISSIKLLSFQFVWP